MRRGIMGAGNSLHGWRGRSVLCAVLAPACLFVPRAHAGTYHWNAGSGNWDNPSDWSPTGLPGNLDDAIIEETDGADRTITYDYPGPAVHIGDLWIDSSDTHAPVQLEFSMAEGNLSADAETIGDSESENYTGGTGSFVQSGGSNSVFELSIAVGIADSGSYALTGTGSVTAAESEIIASGGNATFTQSGGQNTFLGDYSGEQYGLFLGWDGGTGNYVLNSGTLICHSDKAIGYYGTGIFTQSGGTNTITLDPAVAQISPLQIAETPGSTGTYNLSGDGILNVTGDAFVGGSANTVGGTQTAVGGIGTLNISGGMMTVSGTLKIWNDGSAVYLSGGALIAGTLDLDSNISNFHWTGGALTLTDGYSAGSVYVDSVDTTGVCLGTSLTLDANRTLSVAGGVFVGDTGVGTINQSANTCSITNFLSLGRAFGGNGNYNLSGGTLSVAGQPTGTAYDAEYIGQGGDGTFTQTGGTHLLGDSTTPYSLDIGFVLGSLGTYTLSNGTFIVNGIAAVGGTPSASGGTGILNISGGTMTVTGSLNIWNTPNTALNLSGGSLNIGSITTDTNPALINWTSGTLNLTDSGLLIDTTGPLGNSLTLNTGMTLNASGAITNNGTLTLAGGFVGGSVINNSGTITGLGKIISPVINAGTVQSTNKLVFIGTFNNSGGTLDVGSKQIIMGGSGNFPVNSGTITLAGGDFEDLNQPLNNTGRITGYGQLTSGGLTNNGVFTLNGSSTVTGNLTNAAGKTVVIENGNTSFNGNINNDGTVATSQGKIIFGGTYTGHDFVADEHANTENSFKSDVTISSGGKMTGGNLDTFFFGGGTITNNGFVSVLGAFHSSDDFTNNYKATFSGPQTWGAGTTFTNTGTAVFNTDAGSKSSFPLSISTTAGSIIFNSDQHLASLTIASGATVDITDNDVFLANASASTIRSYLIDAYDGGKWDLPGLTSSTAAAGTIAGTSVGYLATGAGAEIKYTWLGDADLNGIVDANDLAAMQSTGATWATGDFNYDGVVNGDDYALFMLGAAVGSSNISLAVPEPADAWIATISLVLGIARRRRISNKAI